MSERMWLDSDWVLEESVIAAIHIKSITLLGVNMSIGIHMLNVPSSYNMQVF